MEKAGAIADRLEAAIGRSRPLISQLSPPEPQAGPGPGPGPAAAAVPELPAAKAKLRPPRRAAEARKPLSPEDQKLLDSLAAVR
jgi:hypothetical protein